MTLQLMTGTWDKHSYSGRDSRPYWKIFFGSEYLQSHIDISVGLESLVRFPVP